MRVLVDLVDSFTGMVRFIIGAVLLVGFGLVFILTAGASYVAPKVAEGATERAAQLGERAIEEARAAQRDHELAQDGWGYGSGGNDSSRSRSSNDRRSGGGWGDNAD
ncbi:hypothetical protein [uncultured Erythrobacter sp.]|uniref:hypothetical protein n=1 Tax=uncultured Erythrobacter sp. TaxID=263913 RepID=UPI002607419B|nr:hypothetical protein [uncultured Erythrobacter sp.]